MIQCISSNSCNVCKNRHHSLLHFNKEASKVVKHTEDSISESIVCQNGVSLKAADSFNRNLDVLHNYNRITSLPRVGVMINVDGRLDSSSFR